MTTEPEPTTDHQSQTCPNCGRIEVAGGYCTFCFRPNDGTSKFPATYPTMAYGRPRDRAIDYIPSEYRGRSQWPEGWGPYPFADD